MKAIVYALVGASLLWGCGAADADEEFGGEAPSDGAGAGDKASCVFDDDCYDGETCFAGQCIFQGEGVGAGGAAAGGDPLPEEVEETFAAFTVPAAGRAHVWVATPATDSVVRIHGETLAIDAIEVGDEPTEVRTRPGHDTAIVLNRGSDELAVVEDPETVRFHLLPGHFNALDLDPSGRHALCWFDLGRVRAGEDAASLQDMAVVDLEDGAVHSVTVGFRPRRVSFTADGVTALVVTDDGVSVFRPGDLRGSTLARTLPVAPDIFGQADREVAVSPDGAYAISRGPGEPGVTIVDLSEGVPRFVPLGAQPSDLDLLPDGRTALIMLREASRLALVPLETAVEDPESVRFIDFEGHVLGSAAVGAAGDFAVLYTTVDAAEARPQVALLELESGAMVHRPMRKGVAGVEVAPDGLTALVLHTKEAGEPDPTLGEETFLARSHGYSLLDMRTLNTKLQTTPARPAGLIFASDRREAFLVLRDEARGVAATQRVDLDGFAVQTWELGTPPEVVGLLPDVERAFVTQTHPEGRISFIDLGATDADGGRLQTVSGYALNGRID